MKSRNNALVREISKVSLPVFKKNGVVRAGIFGSIVRGESKKNSDVDILIKFKGGKGLLDLVRLKIELEEKLGRKVDIVEYSAIHPLLKEKILHEQVVMM